MTMEAFQQSILQHLNNLSEKTNCPILYKEENNTKENGDTAHYIAARIKGYHVSPCLPLQPFYDVLESGRLPFRDVLFEIVKVLEIATKEAVNMNEKLPTLDVTDYSICKPLLFVAFMTPANKEKLFPIEVLSMPLGDQICVIPKLRLNNMVIDLRESHLSDWGITKEQLMLDAICNMEKTMPAQMAIMRTPTYACDKPSNLQWLPARPFFKQLNEAPKPFSFLLETTGEFHYNPSALLYPNLINSILESCGDLMLGCFQGQLLVRSLAHPDRISPKELSAVWAMVQNVVGGSHNSEVVSPYHDILTAPVLLSEIKQWVDNFYQQLSFRE